MTSVDEDLEARLRATATLNVDDLVDLGSVLAEAGRLADAEGVLSPGVGPRVSDSSYNLGSCLAEQERWIEAVAADGDLAGAERHSRHAIKGGDSLAVAALRELLEDWRIAPGGSPAMAWRAAPCTRRIRALAA